MVNMDEKIRNFLDKRDYDVKKSHNARWIDQKCTMDVICMVADCIVEFTNGDVNKEFAIRDIWHSRYAVDNVQNIFTKPDPDKKAQNEYDKYFSQPIKMLAYSGILSEEKGGRGNIYHINEPELLEYISMREQNSLRFIVEYIKKVLRDSKIDHLFKYFFEFQDKVKYKEMKDGFTKFTIDNTPINGATECGRIFAKVVNPLAYSLGKKGTERGHISDDKISYKDLMYNQKNWRDEISGKPKDTTRDDYEIEYQHSKDDYATDYKINRAKKNLRKFNDRYRDGKSECDKYYSDDPAIHMHHIFPASEFQMIADYVENLIALTPNQHLAYAHPNNNTQYVDRLYQYYCLISKAGSIRENLKAENDVPIIYDFLSYKFVLKTGLSDDTFDDIADRDFKTVIEKIDEHYADLEKE